MAPKSLLLAATALAGAALVSAQAAPNWNYIPQACATDCAQTIQSSYLCQTQFSTSTEIYGCFCNDYPSDAATCATCLNSNNAAALGTLLTSTQTACPDAVKKCDFQCAFDTCPSTDVSCQCDATYLANIYNCASCNTANGNTGATQVSDWQSLKDSCANQNFTGAAQDFATKALPSPSTAGYNAPSLTATGGGLAATGDATATDGGLAATTGASGAPAAPSGQSNPTTSHAANASAAASGRSSTTRAAGASASAVSGTGAAGAAGASATPSPTGGASALAAPALAGVAGIAALAAFF